MAVQRPFLMESNGSRKKRTHLDVQGIKGYPKQVKGTISYCVFSVCLVSVLFVFSFDSLPCSITLFFIGSYSDAQPAWDLLGRLARNDGRKGKTKCSGQVWLSLEKTLYGPTLWLAKPSSWPKNLGSRRALVQIPPSYTSPNHKRIRLASEPAILVRRTEKPNQNSGHERSLQWIQQHGSS